MCNPDPSIHSSVSLLNPGPAEPDRRLLWNVLGFGRLMNCHRQRDSRSCLKVSRAQLVSSQVIAGVSHTESHYPEALGSTPSTSAGKSPVIVSLDRLETQSNTQTVC